MTAQGYRFQATIYCIWMMRHINVPDDVACKLKSEILGGRSTSQRQSGRSQYIPVVARVNGRRARTTLVPAGGGRFRRQINTALRKAAKADVGDLVGVELCLDPESRELALPPDLRWGLKYHPRAWEAFHQLTPSHWGHMITYFDSAKSPGAWHRRLDRVIDALIERAMLAPNRARSSNRNSGRAHRGWIKK